MKEQTKKVLKGIFFFVSWVVDFVRYIKKKKDDKSDKTNFVNNK